MRLFFKASPKNSEFRRGWYRFWLATTDGFSMVFRMPDEADETAILHKAGVKITARGLRPTSVLVVPACEYDVVKWLMGHRVKAELGECG